MSTYCTVHKCIPTPNPYHCLRLSPNTPTSTQFASNWGQKDIIMQMPIHFYDDGEFITSPLYSNRTVVSDLFSACEDVKFTVSTPPDAGGCSDLGSRIWSNAVLRPRLTAPSCILDSALCVECGDRFIGGTLFISETKLEVSSDLSQTPVIFPMGEWHCRCMRLKRRRSWRFNQLHLKSLLEEKNLFCVYYSTTLRWYILL